MFPHYLAEMRVPTYIRVDLSALIIQWDEAKQPRWLRIVTLYDEMLQPRIQLID